MQRETLTLDDDVARRLQEEAQRKGQPVDAVANEVLRAGLRVLRGGSPSDFRVEPHDFGFHPEIQLDKLNQLADELEAFETVKRLGP
jgi:hypothetical protein